MIALNEVWTIYAGGVMPHEMKSVNKIDLVNEFIIKIIFLHLFFFTDWVPSKELQYNFGWSMNIFVALLILFNTFFIVKAGGYSIYLVLLKLKNRLCSPRKKKEAPLKRMVSKDDEASDSISQDDQEPQITDLSPTLIAHKPKTSLMSKISLKPTQIHNNNEDVFTPMKTEMNENVGKFHNISFADIEASFMPNVEV